MEVLEMGVLGNGSGEMDYLFISVWFSRWRRTSVLVHWITIMLDPVCAVGDLFCS